jgi:maltooligosyltrehalose synthase
MGEAKRLRRKLALEMAETAKQFYVYDNKRDEDELARMFEVAIPSTYEEILQDWEDMKEDSKEAASGERKPSILDDLRTVLGFKEEDKLSIRCLIQAAIERIEKQK